MAAGLGFKNFVTGEVLTAGDVNGYLMQGINVFTNAAARNAAITSPQEGQFAFTKDTNGLWYYDGAAWVASGATGDIEGVTAGVGISGGGTSGTVTITNSMATEIAAKGDLIAGTGSQTFDNLTVGANNTVLTADSSTATGLKWASPSAGGNFSLINAGGTTLTGASTTVSGISGADKIMVVLQNASGDAAVTDYRITLNGGASTFFYFTQWNKYSTVYAATDFDQDGGAGSTFIKFSRTPTAGSTTAGYILLAGCNAAGVKPFNYVSTVSGADAKIVAIGGGVYEGSSTISSITITPSSGNLDAGKIYIYTSA